MELSKEMIGLESNVSVVDVERRHIRQFAEAIGDDNPLYKDDSFAKNSPYGDLIAPPTFAVALGGEGGELPIELDHRRMLHGEQEFIYYRPIVLGDRLYCKRRISDIYEREGKSGKMQFIVFDTEMRDEQNELVMINRMNIIYRALPEK